MGSCMMKAMLVAALTGCVLAALAQAQESASLYPSRPVTFVVPFTPGGSTSLIARLVGQKPGQLSFASVGPGTIHHLNAEMFKSIFDLNVVHVPYKGSAPALQDIVGGHVQFMFVDAPPTRALIESGKIRALGVTTLQRVA